MSTGVMDPDSAGTPRPARTGPLPTVTETMRGVVPELIIAGAFAALVFGYACWVAFGLHGPLGPRVGYGPDSSVYMKSATAPLWSREFLAGPGPFLFPLLAKVSLRNLRAIVIVQTMISIGAWTYLAASVRALVRDRTLQVLVFAAVLLTALSPRVLEWNAFINTESLSVSVMCLTVGLGCNLARGAGTRTFAAFLVALVAFALARDTNAIEVALMAVAALIAGAVVRSARIRWFAVAGVGAVAAVSALTLSTLADPPRSYYPVIETVSIRVVGDRPAERWFVAHGMPLDDNIRAAGADWLGWHEDVLTTPEFRRYRTWVRAHGQRTYVGYLLHAPGRAVREPFDDRARFLKPDLVGWSALLFHNAPPGVFTWLGALGWPNALPLVEVWLVLAAAALVVAAVKRAVALELALALALVAGLAVIGYYATWHGDVLEIDRHALTVAVQLRVALWAATAVVLDAAWRRRGTSSPGLTAL